jgi:hypothetical protein
MKNYCDIKAHIVRLAVEEEGVVWTDSAGNKKQESDRAMLPDLERYWEKVPGVNAHESAVNAAADREAWSAAFICYVFSEAGIARADGFEFGRRHIIYIVQALRNRENGDTAKPFWLHDSIEILNEATPAPGDLVCYNRFDEHHHYSNFSYSSLRNRYWGNTDVPTGVSHCNVVVAIMEINGRQIIQTIGGNVAQSVSYTFLVIENNQIFEVDEDGSNQRVENDIFGIIKMLECPEFDIN